MKTKLTYVVSVLLCALATSCIFDVKEPVSVKEQTDVTLGFRLEVSSDVISKATVVGDSFENRINTSELIVLAYNALTL